MTSASCAASPRAGGEQGELGLAAGRLPPAGLLQVAETIGAEPWQPELVEWRDVLASMVGELPGELRLYDSLSGRELVSYFGRLRGRPAGERAVEIAPRNLAWQKLIAALRAPHYDVRLSREEMIRLTTWVDANAPYYGSYFGRRNLAYRDRPDFRPVPTLQSAQGCPTGVAAGAAKP